MKFDLWSLRYRLCLNMKMGKPDEMVEELKLSSQGYDSELSLGSENAGGEHRYSVIDHVYADTMDVELPDRPFTLLSSGYAAMILINNTEAHM